jgi:hypothetical protein
MATKNKFVKTGSGFVRPETRTLNPEQWMQQNDPQSLANFQSANPGIPFDQQEMGAYQNAGRVNPFEGGDYSSVTDPADAFNILIFDMMKRAQGVDTLELQKRKRELERAAIGVQQAPADSEISTLAPEQQDAIRAGSLDALRPDIDENAYQLAKAERAIENFRTVYDEAKKMGDEFAKNMVAPQPVIDSYVRKIEQSPEMLSTLLGTLNEKTKQAVIQALDYTKLRTPGKRDTAVVDGRLVDTQTGEVVYDSSGGSGMSPEVRKQNELDAQTVDSAYQTANNIAMAKFGRGLETLTEADYALFTDQEAESIGKALARAQNPDIARQGGDPGQALGATSFKGKAAQYLRGGFEGKKYLPNDIKNAADALMALQRRNASGGASATGGTFSVQAPNGVTYNFSSQEAADAFKQQAGIQ